MFDTAQRRTPVFDHSEAHARVRRRDEVAARMDAQAQRGDLPLKTLIVRPGGVSGKPEIAAYFKSGQSSIIEATYVCREIVNIRAVSHFPTCSVLTHWEALEDIYALKLQAQVLLREIERCSHAAFGADYARWSEYAPDPFTHLYGLQAA